MHTHVHSLLYAMKESLEMVLLPVIHYWTKARPRREECGPTVPPCYASCELLEVRAPGFQGQLSGDMGYELMLMKAAQPCKQHEKMSLEYITIHNCLPRAGGVYMVQPCHHNQMRTHAHTHSHTVAPQSTWISSHAIVFNRRQLLTLLKKKTRNRCVLLNYSEMGRPNSPSDSITAALLI